MARIVVLSRRSIVNPLSGGAGRYVHEILRRLVDHHSITVLAGSFKGCDPVQQIDGITYRHLPGPFCRAIVPLGYVAKYARETDLLIDNSDVGIPWLSPLYATVPRLTIIHQLVREIFYDEFPRPVSDLGFNLEPLMYRLYSRSRIIAASQSTARDLVRCGIKAENIDVIEPGCSNPGVPRSSLPERLPRTIGCVSRLMKYKGLQHALSAFKRVVRHYPDARLLVAGSGPYQPQLVQLARNLGISANVRFLGRISEESKFKLYGEVRMAISPSTREGFGISIIEANSVGTPVLGWDVPGLRDSVIDNETGLLSPFPDEQNFADEILRLLDQDDLWERLSQNAWKWSVFHSWDRAAERFGNVVTGLLAAHRSKAIRPVGY